MTSASFLAAVASGGPAALVILLVRSAPFALHACVTRRLSWRRRSLVVGAVGAIAVVAARLAPGSWAVIAAAPLVALYLVAGSFLVYGLAGWLPGHWIRGGAVLVQAALWFVVLPAALVTHPVVVATIAIGWDIMLSAHSFAVDTAARDPRPSFADCLFFLLVNPAVIYVERGVQVDGARPAVRGVARVLAGTVVMVGRDLALVWIGTTPWLFPHAGAPFLSQYVRFCVTQAVLFLGLYCAHAGLANVQIGWMAVIGYRIPERYHFPFLARDPQDFWRRWNIWVSRWAGRYLYVPLARAWGARSARRSAGLALAVVATFVGIGVLHDLAVYAFRLQARGSGPPPWRITALFVGFGAIVAGWATVARRVRRAQRWLVGPARVALTGLGWIAWVNLVLALTWLGVPILRTGRFPPALEDAVHRWLAHVAG